MILLYIYNNKWQELFDLMLESDYKKRFDIYQVQKFIDKELKINYNEPIKKN